jgi:hypothetical protein
MIKYIMVTYSDNAREYLAVQIPWAEAERTLGHPHDGTAEDDAALVGALLDAGAPAWVGSAEGWTDQRGWGLIGPALGSPDAVIYIRSVAELGRVPLPEGTYQVRGALSGLLPDVSLHALPAIVRRVLALADPTEIRCQSQPAPLVRVGDPEWWDD